MINVNAQPYRQCITLDDYADFINGSNLRDTSNCLMCIRVENGNWSGNIDGSIQIFFSNTTSFSFSITITNNGNSIIGDYWYDDNLFQNSKYIKVSLNGEIANGYVEMGVIGDIKISPEIIYSGVSTIMPSQIYEYSGDSYAAKLFRGNNIKGTGYVLGVNPNSRHITGIVFRTHK